MVLHIICKRIIWTLLIYQREEIRTVSDFTHEWFFTTWLNGFIFTLSCSHKKEMGSKKHTADGSSWRSTAPIIKTFMPVDKHLFERWISYIWLLPSSDNQEQCDSSDSIHHHPPPYVTPNYENGHIFLQPILLTRNQPISSLWLGNHVTANKQHIMGGTLSCPETPSPAPAMPPAPLPVSRSWPPLYLVFE